MKSLTPDYFSFADLFNSATAPLKALYLTVTGKTPPSAPSVAGSDQEFGHIEAYKGLPVYAGGSTTVNIRENSTTSSAVIGNVAAGSVLGTATGNIFPDLERNQHDWYEITTASGRPGYVRSDVASLTAPVKSPSSGSGTSSKTGSENSDYLKTAFDTESDGFPKWAAASVIVCFVLVGVAVYFLVKKRKGKK
ncbi:MAG: SH3 domain-containing protein [Bacteroidales bacterium]|jgi:hypothetical protein|nr:SH3 domain-containing protein [Bacteroidales bacterium]